MEFADYRGDHPPHPSTLERILRGVDGSVEKLISKFEWYMGWLDITNAVHCVDTLLLFQVFLGSRQVPLYVEEYQRMVQSDAYWKTTLTFLERAAILYWHHSAENSHRSTEGPVSARILSNTARLLSHSYEHPIAQRESLLRALVNADFFGMLDNLLPIYAKRHPPHAPRTFRPFVYGPIATEQDLVSMFLEALLLIFQMLGLLSTETPSSAAILRPQLPRPKSLAALLVAAFFKDGQIITTPSPPSDTDVKEISDHQSIQVNFRFFAQLEDACRLETECGRRGCSNEMRARCSVCHKMAYCGPMCQRK